MKQYDGEIAGKMVGQLAVEAKQAVAVNPSDLINKVNSQNDVADILSTIGYELVNGYDNFTLISSLAGFIVKCETTPETVTSEYLNGQTTIIVGILCWRLLGSVFSIIDERIAENDRIEAEKKKLAKVVDRRRSMLKSFNHLSSNDSHNNSLINKKDKWAEFNTRQLSDALEKLSDRNLSELELQQLYLVFRKAVGNNPSQEDVKAWMDYLHYPNKINLIPLCERIELGLNAKVKETPVADKDTRFVGRVLRSIGNFIMANFTGISIVIALSGFIAAIPFFATLGFAATLPAVFLTAIVVGLLYGILTLIQEGKERRHQKITQKLRQEKVRFKQNHAIEKLMSTVTNTVEQHKKVLSLENEQNEGERVLVAKEQVIDSMQPISEKDGGSISWRLIFNLPFILSNASVSGWWAVIMGATVATGLIGWSGLVGFSAIVAPAVAAVLSGLFALSKLIANSYFDYHSEQEKIRQVNNNLEIQRLQARSSDTLRNVIKLSQSELLKEHIHAMIMSTDVGSRKKDFHLIEKMIGAKLSEAINPDAFYGFLVSKLVDGFNLRSHEINKISAKTYVQNLRTLMNGEAETSPIQLHSVFNKKETSFREAFRAFVGYGFSITAPIVVGLGVAMAFIVGPAFFFVGVGMAVFLCATYYVSSMINNRRHERMRNYDAMLAQIDMRDRLAEVNVSKKYSVLNSINNDNNGSHAEELQKNLTSDIKMSEEPDSRHVSSVEQSNNPKLHQGSSISFLSFFSCFNGAESIDESPKTRVEPDVHDALARSVNL